MNWIKKPDSHGFFEKYMAYHVRDNLENIGTTYGKYDLRGWRASRMVTFPMSSNLLINASCVCDNDTITGK